MALHGSANSGGGSGLSAIAANSVLANATGSSATPSAASLAGGLFFTGTTLVAPVDHPGYISGNWYNTIPFINLAAGTAIPASSIRLHPFTVSKPITVNALAARLSTASASGNFQLAIYANNAVAGRPTGSALCSTSSISTTTANPLSATVTSVLLNPGVYWAAVNQDNAVAAYQAPSSGAPGSYLIGSATLSTIAGLSSSITLGLSVAQTFGTWPDLTSGSFTEINGATIAQLYMKAA